MGSTLVLEPKALDPCSLPKNTESSRTPTAYNYPVAPPLQATPATQAHFPSLLGGRRLSLISTLLSCVVSFTCLGLTFLFFLHLGVFHFQTENHPALSARLLCGKWFGPRQYWVGREPSARPAWRRPRTEGVPFSSLGNLGIPPRIGIAGHCGPLSRSCLFLTIWREN